jgi:hypothetical protein
MRSPDPASAWRTLGMARASLHVRALTDDEHAAFLTAGLPSCGAFVPHPQADSAGRPQCQASLAGWLRVADRRSRRVVRTALRPLGRFGPEADQGVDHQSWPAACGKCTDRPAIGLDKMRLMVYDLSNIKSYIIEQEGATL